MLRETIGYAFGGVMVVLAICAMVVFWWTVCMLDVAPVYLEADRAALTQLIKETTQ